MNRLLKLAVWSLIAAGAATVLLAVAVRLLLPPEKARRFIENQLASKLNREVRLGGVSVGLFSGLRVTDFAVSERPTFAAGTFVSSERLDLRLALLPLLAKKIVISNARLVRPFIHLERYADGSFNFSDLRSTTSVSGASPATEPRATPVLNGLSLSRGRIEYAGITIDPLNADIGRVTLRGQVTIEGDLVAHHGTTVSTVTFVAGIDLLQGNIEIKKMDAIIDRSGIFTTGTVSSVFSDPLLTIKTRVQPLDLALLATPGVGGDIRGTFSMRGRPTDFTFDGGIDLSNAVLTSTAGFSKSRGKPMTVAASGRLENLATLTLDPVSIGVGTYRASATGRIDSVMSSTRTFLLAARTDGVPLADVIARLPAHALPPDLSVTGLAAGMVKIEGTAEKGRVTADIDGGALDLRLAGKFHKPATVPLMFHGEGRYALPAEVSFETARLTLSDMKLEGATAWRGGKNPAWSAAMKSGAFPLASVAKLSPKAGDFAPTGTATIDFAARSAGSAAPTINGAYTLRDGSARHAGTEFSGIHAKGTFSTEKQTGAASAAQIRHADADVKTLELAWDLTGVTPDLNRLGGAARLRTGSGEFRNVQKLIDGSRAARVFLLPMGVVRKLDQATGGMLNLPSTDRLVFTSINGNYTFRNGVMTAAPFTLKAEPFDATLTGTAGLAADGPVKAKATIALPKDVVRGTVGQLLAGADGRVAVDVIIGGTVAKPDAKLDLKDTGRQLEDALKSLFR